MAYKEYQYGAWKKEIRALLRKRLNLKDKIRYHRERAKYFEENNLKELDEEINDYLRRAGNDV